MEFISIDATGVTTVFDLPISQPASKPQRDVTTAKENRQARCLRNLVSLLDGREDLRGVYAPADHIADTLRWSA